MGEPRNGRLGVKPLDGLLDVFISASTAQNRVRLHQVEAQPGTERHPDEEEGDVAGTQLPRVICRPNPVVEISSASSAAGKSQLLYYLTAVAVLPSTYEGVPLGGCDSAVVFIDTDGRFDADRLLTIARGIVQQALNHQPETEDKSIVINNLDTILITSLHHVHVFRPQSSASLLATLQNLDTYLLDLSRHHSSNRHLHALILDSASAFLWQDKLHDEVARTEDIGRPAADIEQERASRQSFWLADLYSDLVRELKHVQERLDCAVVYTATAGSGRPTQGQGYQPSGPFDLYTGPPVSNGPAFRASLPPPWGSFPGLRIVAQRDVVRPFPPGVSVDGAHREASMRQEVAMQGKFSAWVNSWRREEWPRRVVDGVERCNGGMFSFAVSRGGVDF